MRMAVLAIVATLAGCAARQNEEPCAHPSSAIIRPYQPGQSATSHTSRKTVLVGGCFDVLHYGHTEFLRKSKASGDYLIVALEPDARIRDYKKREPVHTQQQRAQNLASLRYVDEIVLLPVLKGFEDYSRLVQDIQPNIIALTEGDPQLLNKQKQATSVRASAIIVTDPIGSFSSSAIIKALSD